MVFIHATGVRIPYGVPVKLKDRFRKVAVFLRNDVDGDSNPLSFLFY